MSQILSDLITKVYHPSHRARPSTKILDHIIHLTPPGSVEETSQKFKELEFNVIPGGTHADGLTANALVVFQDGVYLELISFTHEPSHYPPSSPDRQKRESHSWANKSNGWIDYAFLSKSTSSYSAILNGRARQEGSGVEYLEEVDGGRERPDGKVLKWVITSPAEKHGRGTVPFFCGDVTPREWRVPVDPPSNAEHPSKALGIAYIKVLTTNEAFPTLEKQFTSVVGSQPTRSDSTTEAAWDLETPTTSASVSSQSKPNPQLILSGGDGKAGIHEVGIWVGKDKEGPGSIETPYGKVVWVPVE